MSLEDGDNFVTCKLFLDVQHLNLSRIRERDAHASVFES